MTYIISHHLVSTTANAKSLQTAFSSLSLIHVRILTVMKEFRIKAASVTKTDFKTIEHLLRYGYKQKKLIEMPGFRTGSVTSP
jgi:hypothetical protein